MNIPLLDLQAQYMQIKDKMDKAVLDVIQGGRYILGPEVKELEKEIAEYCGTKNGIGVANGTDALLLVLKAWGIGPGDEVITSPFTFFASAEVISQVGATPVFVDVEPETLNIDVKLLESKINERTKAIIAVHIFGQMADMDSLMQLANKHNLLVLEDACQAIGAEYKGRKAGSIGHAGCFSFFPTKNLGGYGDGGMIVTDDDTLAEKIRVLRAHGSKVKYHHTDIGYNSRLDEIQAAILRVKFPHLDNWNDARREKARLYTSWLNGTAYITPCEAPEQKHVFHLYILRSKKREAVMKELQQRGISTAIYYPVPLHLQEVYSSLGYRRGDMPVAEQATHEAFAIPLFPELTKEQMEYIVATLKELG
jgi:dTDP-4-amino-4,6-dideoxygalactose transaminase